MPSLTRPLILAAAVELINADGDVSMRRLATSLSVTAMALYKHYPNKDALLIDVIEEMSRDLELPPAVTDPAEDSARVSRYLHDYLVDRPWMIRFIATSRFASPRGVRFAERLLDNARAAGRDETGAFAFYRTMFAAVLGTATITATKNEQSRTAAAGNSIVEREAGAVPEEFAERWNELDRATGPDAVFTTVAEVLRDRG